MLSPEVLAGIVFELEADIDIVLLLTLQCRIPVVPDKGIVGGAGARGWDGIGDNVLVINALTKSGTGNREEVPTHGGGNTANQNALQLEGIVGNVNLRIRLICVGKR